MTNKTRLAVLLGLGLTAMAASADQKCVAGSIDQVGKCLGRPAAVRQVIDRELHGIEAAPLRAPFDTRLLATQIAGDVALGEVARLNSGPRSDWMLLIRRAEVDREGRLVAAGDGTPFRLAWLRYQPAPAGKKGQETDGERRPLIELKAMAEIAELLPDDRTAGETAGAPGSLPACVDPEGGDNSNGPYTTLNGEYRWLQLSPKRRVLLAGVSRSEGYAGGGGSFAGELMLEVRDGVLVPIACYAISRYQMFGGNWNPDGTREHPESFAAWKLHIQPGGQWPKLRLQPTSPATPAAMLVWDAGRGLYVEVVKRRR
ncbi:MAG: hypothetical protein WAV95_04515 [Azonexus sp.]